MCWSEITLTLEQLYAYKKCISKQGPNEDIPDKNRVCDQQFLT